MARKCLLVRWITVLMEICSSKHKFLVLLRKIIGLHCSLDEMRRASILKASYPISLDTFLIIHFSSPTEEGLH